MKIVELEIEEYKVLKNIKCRFRNNFNVIIGSGKTTLLNCISEILKLLKKNKIYINEDKEVLVNKMQAYFNGKCYCKVQFNSNQNNIINREINRNKCIKPVFLYFKEELNVIDNKNFVEKLKENIIYIYFTNSIIRNIIKSKIITYFNLINNNSEENLMVDIVYSNGEVFIDIVNYNEIIRKPLCMLSYGYKFTLALIVQIFTTVILTNKDISKDNIDEITGIILIDDIEQHIHPKWQTNIVKCLKNIFKEVQFIITTNSPIILSTVEKDEVTIIKDLKEMSGLENMYGRDIDSILNDDNLFK